MTDETPPMSATEATDFLERRKRQMHVEAGTFPTDAFEEALRVAHQREETLVVERDHFRREMWKLGRLLAVCVADADGELVVDTARTEELGDLMLDFAVSEDGNTITVRLEDPPPASPEGSQQPEGET